MTNVPIVSFGKFIRGSRGKSQSEIVKTFLYTLIKSNTVSESGSVHVYNRTTGKLVLFNEDGFLFKQGFLKPGEHWQETFAPWEGLAGTAFGNKQTEGTNHPQADQRFSWKEGGVPIKSIVCAPIICGTSPEPFGVASFHNNSANREFSDEAVALIEAYVDVLGMSLDLSSQKLSLERNMRVFIVHGRDELSLSKLENLLLRNQLQPVLLKDKPKVGPEILEKLEHEIGRCSAGFVLLTPDDEGRLRQDGEALQPRARQNVIFESGYLVAQFRNVRRVCFLMKRPLEKPSDMDGLLYEAFDSIETIAEKIRGVLEEWELIETGSSTTRSS